MHRVIVYKAFMLYYIIYLSENSESQNSAGNGQAGTVGGEMGSTWATACCGVPSVSMSSTVARGQFKAISLSNGIATEATART